MARELISGPTLCLHPFILCCFRVLIFRFLARCQSASRVAPFNGQFAMPGDKIIVIVPRLFEEKRRDIVFGFPSVLPSFHPPKVLCTLCAQLLLQFYADSFENLQMFCHGLKICMWFGYYLEIIFVTFTAI